MPTEPAPAPATALSIALALVTTSLLAGCVVPVPEGSWSSTGLQGTSAAEQPRWGEGDWWAYRVTILGNTTLEMALVVDDAHADGYRLGNNASRGFFGLPFHGNMSPDLHPRIGDQTWRMFEFPLQDGRSWDQELYGHNVHTTVEATSVSLPDGSTDDGYELEATTYGALLSRYTYSPTAGWMTSFLLRDPGTRDVLLEAELVDHGRDYSKGYYVREPLRTVEVTYPTDLPGTTEVPIEQGERIAATLVVRGDAGLLDARFLNPQGEEVLHARSTASGTATDEATVPAADGTWELHHTGAGAGRVLLQLHTVERVGPADAPSDPGPAPSSGGGNLPGALAIPLG